ENQRARDRRALVVQFIAAWPPQRRQAAVASPSRRRPARDPYSQGASAGFFSRTRQSWKPWPLIAFSIARRDRLCGGARSGRITPVACQGPCCAGSLLPEESPAKARKSLLASDLNMKMCITGVSFQREESRGTPRP